MALFGTRVKFRNKTNIQGFNAEYLNDKSAIQKRKRMGVTRTVFSAISLIIGGAMFYVALHYIPAFVQPKQVLKFATGDSAAMRTYDFDRKSKLHKIFGPYAKLFHLDRAYLKPGQSIEIKYDLPAGAYAELDIVQCRRFWVMEIFNCQVVSRFSTKTKRRSGVESYALNDGGFYHFRQKVIGVPDGEPYRIVWERGL